MNSGYGLKECPVCGKKGRLDYRTLDFDYVGADGQLVEGKRFYIVRCGCPRKPFVWYEDSAVAELTWNNFIDFLIKTMSKPQGEHQNE